MAAPHSIAPQEMQDTFTSEQKEYLAGFLLAVAKRGETFFVGKTASGLLQTALDLTALDRTGACQILLLRLKKRPGSARRSMICARRSAWKYEENPLDLWDKVLAHADEDRFPEAATFFASNFTASFTSLPHRTRSCSGCAHRPAVCARIRCVGLPEWRRTGEGAKRTSLREATSRSASFSQRTSSAF